MIIQRVIKGITGITQTDAARVLNIGILCNWWWKIGSLPQNEVPLRLNDRNLHWHQNRYADPDPTEGNEPFGRHTPFISTSAGTVERDAALSRNILTPAWQIAMEFATNGWRQDGCLFYCYLFVIGRRSIPHQAFSEEIRELNIFTPFSLFQPEGEITAKIIIPPAQIERFEFYDIKAVQGDRLAGRRPRPSAWAANRLFAPPEDISNMRDLLV